MFVSHRFLLQVAAQRVKDLVDCSGVLRSIPALVNRQRCHNQVKHLGQLVSEKDSVPVVMELQLFRRIHELFPAAMALLSVRIQIRRPRLNGAPSFFLKRCFIPRQVIAHRGPFYDL